MLHINHAKTSILLIVLVLTLTLVAACSPGNPNTTTISPTTSTPGTAPTTQNQYGKTIIAYAGGTCEAATFVAYHKDLFKAEGLDVELVQMGFDQLKQALTTGKVDAAMANFAWIKAIEQGLNIKLTGGIHTGCIKAVAPPDSGIKTIADLKGKAIGIDSIGGGPMIALSIKLKENGIDPQKDVQWRAYPGAQLDQAIANNEIQAYMTWDPFPTMAHDHNHYVTLLDIGTDDPFKNLYCCFSGVSGDLIKSNPAKAAAITRAFLKAADWVGQNPQEAAQIELDNKYVGGDLALNSKLLASYSWNPSIKQAEENVQYYIREQKAQGILEASSDETVLFQQIFGEVIPDYNGK